MQALSLLVARYGALAVRSSVVKTTVAEAIKNATGVRLEAGDIDVKEGEVRVSVSGARRAALFMKKDAAVEAASAALGGKMTSFR